MDVGQNNKGMRMRARGGLGRVRGAGALGTGMMDEEDEDSGASREGLAS